jgi:TadE-like protein
MPPSSHPANPPPTPRRESGQSVVELALILPVILLLLVAIADLGRIYTSAVAIESAAREAADFGAFDASYWVADGLNYVTTTDGMRRRACTAAAGSHLQGYETTDPVNNSTCTNPSFTCTLERDGAAADCSTSAGSINGTDCSDPATEPPCMVHVRLDYQFKLILAIPPLPGSIQISRDSYFRISNLQAPTTP